MKNSHHILIALSLLILTSCGTSKSMHHQPTIEGYNTTISEVIVHSNSLSTLANNILKHDKSGHWQLYIEGDAYQRGLVNGSLTKKILNFQEKVFFDKILDIVPSKFKQNLLRGFLKWYNRKLYLNVTEEYKTEIYGLSSYSSNDYNYIAKPYLRSLYLHGAHDIGHALQDLALVGCSSFAAWKNKTEDGKLILGRNFDFYAGDEFAKNKIIAFVKPKKGIPFMMVTWAGMIGAVSGMNTAGITVTLNAGKSDMPLIAKTPISLVAREILQYASNIKEAIEIAKKRDVFVAEALMIGSAADNKAILIEMSPNNFGVYNVGNSNQLICSNHFQSEAYKNDKNNINQIKESHSKYRFDKMVALFDENPKITPKIAVSILRNKEGLQDKKIGYGNEKALNQLLAHHGIVFKPADKKVWVSANPYQLGKFVCYDLDEIFSNKLHNKFNFEDKFSSIAADSFINSEAYKNYETYRVLDRKIDSLLSKKKPVFSNSELAHYISLNPNLWSVYYKVGVLYENKGYFAKAKPYFETALLKEVTTTPDLDAIQKHLKECKKKIKN